MVIAIHAVAPPTKLEMEEVPSPEPEGDLWDQFTVLEDNADKKYVCPRCGYLVRDAVQQICCGHWLCECCAKKLSLEISPRCPLKGCLEHWKDNETYFPDRFVRKSIGKFSVKCNGCSWVGTIETMKNHRAECVPNDQVKGQKILCKEEALITCPYLKYGCTHAEKMTKMQLDNHLLTTEGLVNHLELLTHYLIRHTDDFIFQDDRLIMNNFVSGIATKKYPPIIVDNPEEPMEDATRYACQTSSEVDSVWSPSPSVDCKGYLSPVDYSEKMKQDLVLIQKADSKRVAPSQRPVEKLSQSMTIEAKNPEFHLVQMGTSCTYDGTNFWKIPQFLQRIEDVQSGKYTSIFSLPFYTSQRGYKLCLRLYILGDGIGKGTHMSLFLVIMKGEFDAILQWPFTHKVSFRLINQHHGRDIVDVFQPDPLSSSFQRPKTDMNVASGCPRFVSLAKFNPEEFLINNSVHILAKVHVETDN